MRSDLSILIPFEPRNAAVAGAFAQDLTQARPVGAPYRVILAGHGPMTAPPGAEVISGIIGKGRSVREALSRVEGGITVLQDPDEAYSTSAYSSLVKPITSGAADAVFGSRHQGSRWAALPDRALTRFTHFVTDISLSDPLTGLKAFRTEALQSLKLNSDDGAIDAEIVVKLAAQLFRLAEVPLGLHRRSQDSMSAWFDRAAALFRYATTQNDADNQHDGYNTLLRMESAPNYNAWLGNRIRPHLGQRVLEVGAGIGTITRQIEAGRELVIALEVDKFYVDRLKNLFRDKPHIEPYLSNVELADWEALKARRIDSIIQSNVLEHIEDDGEAVRRFRKVLQPGGTLVTLVPALPQLYGTIDSAVGHFRRYTPASLRTVLEANGFRVAQLEWMNFLGIPGWFLNGRILKRRAVPPLQLRLYDQVAPLLAQAESRLPLPVGMSLIAVAHAS